MFVRVTITLGIGPHSSLSCNLFVCNMICYLIHNYAHKFMDIVVVGHLKHDDNFDTLMYTSQICLSMKFLPCDTMLVQCMLWPCVYDPFLCLSQVGVLPDQLNIMQTRQHNSILQCESKKRVPPYTWL